ncbi:hypothetical protein DJ480_10180 [Pseudomonas sp. Leaf98]|nr:hypothetical protein DJ480_10180 [Pseudomonas sp. Leaf98]
MYCDLNVGAGLLANAVDQSTSSVTDTPHSRASPLPHLAQYSLRDQVGCQAAGRASVSTCSRIFCVACGEATEA